MGFFVYQNFFKIVGGSIAAIWFAQSVVYANFEFARLYIYRHRRMYPDPSPPHEAMVKSREKFFLRQKPIADTWRTHFPKFSEDQKTEA